MGTRLIGGLLPSIEGTDLIMAVDYFTKWIKVRLLKRIIEKKAIKFLHDQIWCRFELSRAMLSVMEHSLRPLSQRCVMRNWSNIGNHLSHILRETGRLKQLIS